MKAKHFILITFFLFIFNNKSLAQQHITDSNEITIYHKALEFFNNKNYQEALALLMPAAKRGFAKAQNLLAICYAYECGVDFDGEEALTWYEKAANQGLDDAQYNLGIIYAYGNIGYHYWGDKNIEKAIQLFKLSAEQGNEAAINKIVEIKSYESITKEYNIVRSGAVDLGLNLSSTYKCNFLGADNKQ